MEDGARRREEKFLQIKTSKLIPIFTLEIKKNRERNLLLPSLLFPQHEIKKKKKNKRCTKRKKKRETEWRGLEVSFEKRVEEGSF